MLPKVFVSRRIPDVGMTKIAQHATIDLWNEKLPPTAEQLIDRAQGCVGVVSMLCDRFDAGVMDAIGPQLRVISNYAVGYNNIDIDAATQRSIAVGNTPGVLTDATADIAAGLILACARRFSEAIQNVKHQHWVTWEAMGFLGFDLRGKTLGVIGMGRIGAALAQRMYGGWAMKVIYTSRSDRSQLASPFKGQHVDLETLLQQSDVVSIHCDLNPSTAHLICDATLKQMRPSAILVNTSRGGVIDQSALASALQNGVIAGAGLDVTDPEPIPADNPLLDCDNCLILPHIGSATLEARQAMANIVADNLIAGLQTQPLPFPVNP